MDDKRLIEDYLPIEAISKEASREKSVRKGHISTLHLWWARRPLVACRAAVYGALVPASQFVPNANSDVKKKSLGRANAAKFITGLCKYPGSPHYVNEAQHHILAAHANRLSQEIADWKAGKTGEPSWLNEFRFTGDIVTETDITEGRAPRPKVLDMFAGGGAIPLEALRLGCDAYALDLNPVAHIIELCTLVYPQKYGKPDPTARGMTGPKNEKGEATWGGLAEEVRYWGKWVLRKVKAEIGDLYPPIPDPKAPKTRHVLGKAQIEMAGEGFEHQGQQSLAIEAPSGYLTPVAYLWTRTVVCKNPSCKRTVPLVKHTWLCKKEKRYVAMRVTANRKTGQVQFDVAEANDPTKLGFSPDLGLAGPSATCLFCGTVADGDYVKAEGCAGRIGTQLMAVACTRPGKQGKVYLSAEKVPQECVNDKQIGRRIGEFCSRTGLTVPFEPIEGRMTGGICLPYGLDDFGKLYTPRQTLTMLALVASARGALKEMLTVNYEAEWAQAVATYLALMVDRLADFNSSLCVFNYTGGRGVKNTFSRQALPMVWDFAETNPFNPDAASWVSAIDDVPAGLSDIVLPRFAHVARGSATSLPWRDRCMDAVVTDPPYYDNIDYAKISDFFYVWLRRTIGDVYPEHFATATTPKRSEAVADPVRHDGSKQRARLAYEQKIADAFREAHRVLKPNGQLSVVYAHKTTLGWATLVKSLREAGFAVVEAWPLDTEKPGRIQSQGTAALASSITLACRKREESRVGRHEDVVRPELEGIVRERVTSLWELGISGADLVIACLGAGLRAFTRFARVEYANGEEVPAERFLAEVETVVLEAILARMSREAGGNGGKYSLAGLDPATRFYVLWRYTYKAADLDAGEAIIFANGTHVELDGLHGLSYGSRPLVEKKKGKYRLLDYTERGDDTKLGLPSEEGQPVPLVDALHRLLWLMERHPSAIPEFLQEARPNAEQLRLVAQALAGPALKGGELGEVATGSELAALTKLTANWRSVVEDAEVWLKGHCSRLQGCKDKRSHDELS